MPKVYPREVKTLPPPIRDSFARDWGLDPEALTFLGGGQDWSDGTLFSTPEPGATVLKVLDFPVEDREALERAEERVRLVRFLGDQGCPIVTPLTDREGRLHRARVTGDRLYLAYAYPRVPGRSFRRDDPAVESGALFEAFGEVLGRLHRASQARGVGAHSDGSDAESRVLRGWRQEMSFFRSWCQEPAVADAWDHLREALSSLSTSPAVYGFVHNDLHLANLIYDPEAAGPLGLTVIDFDVANDHWYMADAAIALYSLACLGAGGLETASGPPPGWNDRAWPAFWRGYQRHRIPSDEEKTWVELFVHYRRCLLFMPLQNETAKDPAWRSRWVSRIVDEDARLFG